MAPTLVVMAAGMGSRFGGTKQLAGVGPSGETILDYSVHDAISAGFGKVVFVIRKAFADAFLVLNRRISLLANLSFDKLSRLSLQTELDRIGQA